MYQNIDEIDFAEKFEADDNGVLLDVRTQEEYDGGFIAGCELMDIFQPDFKSKLEGLDKSKNYYVYCRSGNRSGQACGLMAQMGFTGQLYNLEGGILGWTQNLEY
ncbi:Rhodanese-related sulfurtransferase [Reichenbachiella faecimaris]|uniref:Rhodanese-related sulfurtransferase n=1 Tax=Reichenbachiella faecimaris TaxID=692418 RepID=A0A1W2GKP2_REIFA|nr:rhodanese-like domain-containing protein [Reichenbachiella faecimaris]SMD37141.1 Rhodanese-related sulfurtransferase [Reichenbachiella faecimaris]